MTSWVSRSVLLSALFLGCLLLVECQPQTMTRPMYRQVTNNWAAQRSPSRNWEAPRPQGLQRQQTVDLGSFFSGGGGGGGAAPPRREQSPVRGEACKPCVCNNKQSYPQYTMQSKADTRSREPNRYAKGGYQQQPQTVDLGSLFGGGGGAGGRGRSPSPQPNQRQSGRGGNQQQVDMGSLFGGGRSASPRPDQRQQLQTQRLSTRSFPDIQDHVMAIQAIQEIHRRMQAFLLRVRRLLRQRARQRKRRKRGAKRRGRGKQRGRKAARTTLGLPKDYLRPHHDTTRYKQPTHTSHTHTVRKTTQSSSPHHNHKPKNTSPHHSHKNRKKRKHSHVTTHHKTTQSHKAHKKSKNTTPSGSSHHTHRESKSTTPISSSHHTHKESKITTPLSSPQHNHKQPKTTPSSSRVTTPLSSPQHSHKGAESTPPSVPYREATSLGSPQHSYKESESTPTSSPYYRDATPLSSPQYRHKESQGTPPSSPYRDATPLGSPQHSHKEEETTPQSPIVPGSPRQNSRNEQWSAFELECLKAHNEHRARHGVPALQLNRELCQSSQQYADQLARTDPEENMQHSRYSENLSATRGYAVTGRSAVDDWYNEIHDYDWNTAGSKNGKEFAHFTLLVWKSVTDVGVGYAKSAKGNTYVVCHYAPMGNVKGEFHENVLRPRY